MIAYKWPQKHLQCLHILYNLPNFSLETRCTNFSPSWHNLWDLIMHSQDLKDWGSLTSEVSKRSRKWSQTALRRACCSTPVKLSSYSLEKRTIQSAYSVFLLAISPGESSSEKWKTRYLLGIDGHESLLGILIPPLLPWEKRIIFDIDGTPHTLLPFPHFIYIPKLIGFP